MDEAAWLECTDPEKMLPSLYGKASPRKMRLAAVACCRHVAHLLPEEGRCRRAMEVAESFADCRVSRQEMTAARRGANAEHNAVRATNKNCERMAANLASAAVLWASEPTQRPCCSVRWAVTDALFAKLGWSDFTKLHYPHHAVGCAHCAVFWATLPAAAARSPGASWVSSYSEAAEAAKAVERKVQTTILQDIFNNPFRPISLDPTWRTLTVVSLAQAAYDEPLLPAGTLDLDRLGVLADALLDAGCDNADVLGHLRSEGPHVRGCWVVDLLLGKE